jgi:DNA repair protein RecN (Recombination protein N)
MLRELSIWQFAIVEEAHIEFEHGFHVITGETGAGKSILIDALGLLLGGRASSDWVRHGAEKAEIEGVFEVEPHHPAMQIMKDWGWDAEDGMILLRREILANGKSIARINGRMVTVSMLKQLGATLLDLSGQHEHQSLLSPEEHLEWLDRFGGESLIEAKSSYQAVYRQFLEVDQELRRLMTNQQEIAQRIDLYQFQLKEIDEAQLVDGEEEELESEYRRLANGEKLLSHVSQAYRALYGDGQAFDLLQTSLAALEEAATIDEQISPVMEMVQSAVYQIEEAVRELSSYQDTLEFEPTRLHEVQERLHLIRQLKRKYGNSIAEILSYRDKIAKELDFLENRDENLEELRKKREQLLKQLQELAEQLTQFRKRAATILESRVEQELKELHMGSTVFHVAFYPISKSFPFSASGQDRVEFLISPNPGEPLRPLAKIASGGELSRIMLALKCIFTDLMSISTLVFDEIDTGVSGRAAQAIAEKMARLGMQYQVLCVTHLPQVACMADVHFGISKMVVDEKTKTQIEKLDEQARTHELARLLGGAEVTETTLEHAREMIRLAAQVKEKLKMADLIR